MQIPKSITWPPNSCRRPSMPFREMMQDGVIMLRLCHNPAVASQAVCNHLGVQLEGVDFLLGNRMLKGKDEICQIGGSQNWPTLFGTDVGKIWG